MKKIENITVTANPHNLMKWGYVVFFGLFISATCLYMYNIGVFDSVGGGKTKKAASSIVTDSANNGNVDDTVVSFYK